MISFPSNDKFEGTFMDDVSPVAFVNGLWGFQVTASLKAALGLDLFTAIAEGATTAPALAARTGAAERGVRILADFLTVRGFLEKHDGAWRLTPSSAAFLDRRSPAYAGTLAEFIASPEMIDLTLADPVATVKAGGSLGLANVAVDNPIWVKFARAMMPFAAPSAQSIAAMAASWSTPPRKVVDIAAGHGLFGIFLAQKVPQAEIVAVDWHNVLPVAREHAEQMGVAARYRLLEGNAFEVDWGGDCDLVLIPNFLHHFDVPTCTAFLRKVRGTLAPGGRVLAVEFVPEPDRITPPTPAAFAYTMLTTTPHGDAYTLADYEAMARDAGFSGVAATPLPPTPQTLVEFVR